MSKAQNQRKRQNIKKITSLNLMRNTVEGNGQSFFNAAQQHENLKEVLKDTSNRN
jgi:hypothetical protein